MKTLMLALVACLSLTWLGCAEEMDYAGPVTVYQARTQLPSLIVDRLFAAAEDRKRQGFLLFPPASSVLQNHNRGAG